MTEIEKIVWCAKALWRLPRRLCERYWEWRNAWGDSEMAARKQAEIAALKQAAARRPPPPATLVPSQLFTSVALTASEINMRAANVRRAQDYLKWLEQQERTRYEI